MAVDEVVNWEIVAKDNPTPLPPGPDGRRAARIALTLQEIMASIARYRDTLSGVTGTLLLSAAEPRLSWNETDQTANNRYWDILPVAEQLRFRAVNDAQTVFTNWMTVDRTTTTIDSINMTATTITHTGEVDITGDTRIGNSFTSVYRLSVQRNAANTYIEILNSGGAGQGVFFGIENFLTAQDFALYNWQGGPIVFYTDTTASSFVRRYTIEAGGDHRFNSGDVFIEAGNLDVSGTFTSGTGNAFSIEAAGYITDYPGSPADGEALVWVNANTRFEAMAVGGTPGGADTQIQYNNSSAFGGISGFTFNNSTNQLDINAAYNSSTEGLLTVENTSNTSGAASITALKGGSGNSGFALEVSYSSSGSSGNAARITATSATGSGTVALLVQNQATTGANRHGVRGDISSTGNFSSGVVGDAQAATGRVYGVTGFHSSSNALAASIAAWDSGAVGFTYLETGGDENILSNDGTNDTFRVQDGEIMLRERSDHISTPAAAEGYMWVRDDAPNVPIFTNDAGTDFLMAGEVTATTTELEDITDAINTDPRKVEGFQVFNTTTNTPVWAVGSADGSVWVDATATTAHTPV